jgi:hypothetical protein
MIITAEVEPCIHITAPTAITKAAIEPTKGQGLGSTR